MSSGFFRGTNTEQDSRFGDSDKKLMKKMKFSKILDQKVNMKKVNTDVMKRWIAQRITSLLGFEDDIVVGTCVNYLSEEDHSRESDLDNNSLGRTVDFLQGKLDPKRLQLQLTGFLEKSTSTFMEELWGLLVDAQNSLGGIPSAFLQDKKQEMLKAKEEEHRQEVELQKRMTEHQQEMEHAALLAEAAKRVAASTTDLPHSSGGARASRWGKPVQDLDAKLMQPELLSSLELAPAANSKEENESGKEADVGFHPTSSEQEVNEGQEDTTAESRSEVDKKESRKNVSAEESSGHAVDRLDDEKRDRSEQLPQPQRVLTPKRKRSGSDLSQDDKQSKNRDGAKGYGKGHEKSKSRKHDHRRPDEQNKDRRSREGRRESPIMRGRRGGDASRSRDRARYSDGERRQEGSRKRDGDRSRERRSERNQEIDLGLEKRGKSRGSPRRDDRERKARYNGKQHGRGDLRSSRDRSKESNKTSRHRASRRRTDESSEGDDADRAKEYLSESDEENGLGSSTDGASDAQARLEREDNLRKMALAALARRSS